MTKLSHSRRAASQVPLVKYEGSLVLFTSFYEQRGYAGYIHSLAVTGMVLERIGVKWDYWPSAGDFHVERAVNLALSRFVASDFTDFLNIDADESWDPEGLLRLISRPDPVVGGLYRMKNKWDTWTGTLKVNENGVPEGKVQDGSPMIEAKGLPFGFLRLKKEPLIAYQKAFPDRWYWDGEEKVTQFLTTRIRDNTFFSQDINFSLDMKELGFPLWIEPNVTIGHFGLVEHIGNLDRELRDLHADQKRTPMERIEAFAKERSAA